MAMACWLIGRKIVLAVQERQERAEYRKRLLEILSARLAEQFGMAYLPPEPADFSAALSGLRRPHRDSLPIGKRIAKSLTTRPDG